MPSCGHPECHRSNCEWEPLGRWALSMGFAVDMRGWMFMGIEEHEEFGAVFSYKHHLTRQYICVSDTLNTFISCPTDADPWRRVEASDEETLEILKRCTVGDVLCSEDFRPAVEAGEPWAVECQRLADEAWDSLPPVPTVDGRIPLSEGRKRTAVFEALAAAQSEVYWAAHPLA